MKRYFIISLIIILMPLIAQADGDEGCFHMMDWYGWGGAGMLALPFFWLLLIGGLVYLFVKGFGRSQSDTSRGKSRSALEILKERYAKGEIDKKKFEEMKKDIGE